ncbi:MAG: argonaute PAZ domain-containing protein [Prochloraceae cyanobacterium]
MNSTPEVLLNRFAIKKLNERERSVNVYSYTFKTPPQPGKEFSEINKILWNIRTPGALLGKNIVTKDPVLQNYLDGKNYKLQSQGTQVLNPQEEKEREALERIERRWLEKRLKQGSKKNRVERYNFGGLIWWNAEKTILKNKGWEVHTGVRLDVSIHNLGFLFLEIDIHHRFYSPWTLQKWFDNNPDIPITWLRNTYDDRTWKYLRTSNENPETLQIPGLNMSLADYHRSHKISASEAEISNSRVVYVKGKKGESAHLSSRLRPSITMEILSFLADRGEKEAGQVFKQVRKSVNDRFTKANEVAEWLAKNIYRQQNIKLKPQKITGILFKSKSPILLIKSKQKVYRAKDSLEKGCLRTGEKQFGFLDLVGNGMRSETAIIYKKLEYIAKKSGTEIFLETPRSQTELPDKERSRRQFWQNWANQGTHTVLVVTNWLENDRKTQLRREALEANIALKFMLPMPKKDDYRLDNIILGLLVKAKWQTVGLEPLEDKYAADLVVGFDAGTNRNLYYGTSAFAILANGQSIGWEIPEAQPGETLSGRSVVRTILNLIDRFERIENRIPKRILLLRDGLIQNNEFDYTLETLKDENIAVDLLEVRKSGTGRMAIKQFDSYSMKDILTDAKEGTAILSQDNKTFRIVTSKAIAGGSARPLQVVRYCGDAPLKVLAKQIYRLSMLHPASAYSSSRLPMVLHFADRMAKEVQRLGETGILQSVDREKIFF